VLLSVIILKRWKPILPRIRWVYVACMCMCMLHARCKELRGCLVYINL
jgi:hypothetical protein